MPDAPISVLPDQSSPRAKRGIQQCGTTKAPPGWYCTRDHGHDGPCAAHFEGEPDAQSPHAVVRRKRVWPWVVVQRTKADGSYDWFTYHLTRRAARRAVDAYRRDGTVKGIRA